MKYKSNLKKIMPILLGCTLEAYDFALYGLLAVYFSKIFFPPDSKRSLVFAFFLFSIAYLSRPIGSAIWGHIADKYGRKPVLIGTLTMMAIPAIGMACMPSYASIGVFACIAIVFLRLLQGLAFGGEFPTIIVTMYELAPDNRKGFFGSLADDFAIMGYLVGLCLIVFFNAILNEQQMTDWGWRMLFGVSIIFILLVSYIRYALIETRPNTNSDFLPISLAIKDNWLSMIKIIVYMMAPFCLYFNLIFYTNTLIQTKTTISSFQSFLIQASVVAFCIILIPIMGYISDIFGRKKLTVIAYISMIFLAFPIYVLLLSGNIFLTTFGYVCFGILTSITTATFPAIIVDQSSIDCRVSTVGVSHSIAAGIGSFIPMTNELLINMIGSNKSPVILITLLCTLSLIILFFMNDSQYLEAEYGQSSKNLKS